MLHFLQKTRVGDESFYYSQKNSNLSERITLIDEKIYNVEKRVTNNENEINTLKSKIFRCVIS